MSEKYDLTSDKPFINENQEDNNFIHTNSYYYSPSIVEKITDEVDYFDSNTSKGNDLNKLPYKIVKSLNLTSRRLIILNKQLFFIFVQNYYL
jgi:hypothetical protein